MMRAKNNLKKFNFDNLDILVKECDKIAKQWDKNTIPLTVFKTFLDTLEITPEENADDKIVALFNAYNNVLDQLYNTCKTQAKEMRSKDISIQYIKECIVIIKNKFKEGLNEPNNTNSGK